MQESETYRTPTGTQQYFQFLLYPRKDAHKLTHNNAMPIYCEAEVSVKTNGDLR